MNLVHRALAVIVLGCGAAFAGVYDGGEVRNAMGPLVQHSPAEDRAEGQKGVGDASIWWQLDHDVVDAEYSYATQEIVTVSSNPDRLKLLKPWSEQDKLNIPLWSILLLSPYRLMVNTSLLVMIEKLRFSIWRPTRS